MGENDPLERAIEATNSQIVSASKVIDTMAIGWTDEAHRLYLDSIEASFVKRLYRSKYSSKNLPAWLPRTKTNTNSSESDSNDQSFDQFKVLRKGCWEKLKVGRAKNQDENDDEPCKLAENPWIQHFRSHCTTKEPHATLASQLKDSNLAGPLVHLINKRNEREATCSKEPPSSPSPCSRKIHGFSVGGITEFSDQNFVDMESEREEESSGRRGKKRVFAYDETNEGQGSMQTEPCSLF